MDMMKEMNKIALLAALVLPGAGLFAQQDPHFTMYMFNKQVLNPAYAGSKGVPFLQGLYRSQWVGIEGAPQTFNLGFHGPVGRSEKVALGVYALNDRIGVDQHTGLYGQYAYHFEVGSDVWMSLGLQAGVTRYQGRLSELDQPLWAYPADPLVSSDVVGAWLPNAGVGAYMWGNHFYAGISVPHLFNNYYEPDRDPSQFDRTARQYRHYFAFAGVRLDITQKFAIQPQAMVKNVVGNDIKVPLSADLDLGFIFNDIIMFGLAYRLNDSFDAYFRAQLTKRFELGYAYDFTRSALGDYTSGSHEIMLAYKFGGEIVRIIGPRQKQWTF
jgi:type IX secretion system PorP/SprF family membrane protein